MAEADTSDVSFGELGEKGQARLAIEEVREGMGVLVVSTERRGAAAGSNTSSEVYVNSYRATVISPPETGTTQITVRDTRTDSLSVFRVGTHDTPDRNTVPTGRGAELRPVPRVLEVNLYFLFHQLSFDLGS